MSLQKTFFDFLTEIKKSVQEFQISDDLHNTFVMFIYTVYHFGLFYVVLFFTTLHRFAMTYLPLPKINSD